MWGTDLGSLGDLVAEDLALYVAEVCVQRYRLQNQKERKKKKWIYELKVFDEITQREKLTILLRIVLLFLLVLFL